MNRFDFNNGDSVPFIIRGLWQLSSGHQNVDVHSLVHCIEDAIACGFDTFDCADIYVGTEELLGKVGVRHAGKLRFHTKYVPDLGSLAKLTFNDTESIIDRSLKRLRVDCLDLVQFHWWDYGCPRYRDALEHLALLQERGKIRSIGVTNFDTDHFAEILDAGFKIVSIQLAASLIDGRAQGPMKKLCKKWNVRRLGYGSLLGGFLSERWLGQPEPSELNLPNRSLKKYKLIIDDWGGWSKFQEFLCFLSQLAGERKASISQIAIGALLQSEQVDAVISGLSPLNYQAQNRSLRKLVELSMADLAKLASWGSALEGDVYALERGSKHSSLMRTNLNEVSGRFSNRDPLSNPDAN